MTNLDAYKERSRELFSEHEEWKDYSFVFAFNMYLTVNLAIMGAEPDVEISEAGGNTLRHAAANEADGLTADLRKKHEVLEQLSTELESSDAVALLRLLNKAANAILDSRLQRYETILASLSESDRDILNTVEFVKGSAERNRGLRKPVNADHLYDTLATEFPDIVLERAKKEFEEYSQTKGKRYEMHVEHGPTECSRAYNAAGDSMKVGSRNIFGSYKLVDE